MIIVTDSDGLVLMWSERARPSAPSGGAVIELSAQLESEFRDLPVGAGVTFDGASFEVLPEPPLPAPDIASAGDFVRALYELGWLEDVEAAVAAENGLAEKLWNRAAIFERHHPMVAQIASAIGKTEDDLDTLFTLAGSYV